MSDWRLAVPETTQNFALNSSAEITGNFANVGGGAATRVTTRAKYGLYSYRLVTGGDNEGMTLTLSALDNAIHHVTMRVNDATLASTWDWSLDNVAYTSPTLVEAIDGTWSLYELAFSAAEANGSTLLYIRQDGGAALDINIDGVQVEEKDGYYTTFCDGDQNGCESLGAEHASVSQRSAQSRAGGRLRDLKDFYGFGVANFMNTGMPTQSTEIDNYALLPGGQLNDIKIEPREFTLMGTLSPAKIADCTKSLDDVRADLEEELAHDRYPEDADGWQPLLIRYVGDDVQKEIAAHYSGGLEGRIAVNNQIQETVPMRFSAPDPNWYEIGQSAQLLDTEDTATLRYVSGRLRSTGQWDDLGLTANPTANGQISVIFQASDGSVYAGGLFTGMDTVAGRDFIARYIPSTDTWETVGGASDFNGTVFALVEGPDGIIYAGGSFTNVAGVAAADYIAQWDGANWTAVGVPVAGAAAIVTVRALVFDQSGNLIIGFDGINWANIANADYIVLWNGAAYSALSTGMNNDVRAVAIHPVTGNLFAGGDFTLAGGAAIDMIAEWDGSTWSSLGTGASSEVFGLAFAPDGTLYMVGAFLTADGVTVNRIASWNGTTFSALDVGADQTIAAITIGPDGMIFVSGTFTTIGGIAVADRIARWNGSSWAHLGVNLPGTPSVASIDTGPADPVISRNYNLWIGFNTTGAGTFAGSADVANDGTAHTFPRFITERTGGTSAILETLRNETLGLELLYNYSLLDGETLITDNDPLSQSIVSNFFASRLDATLAGDDFGDWSLQPGTNQVTSFIDNTGATIEAFLLYRDAFKGHGD